MSDPIPLKGSPATSTQKAWHQYLKTQQEETPKRLEEAAKFLSGIISITLSILLVGDEKLLQAASKLLVGIAALLWLLALLASLWVIFPVRYPHNALSAESIEKTHHRVVKNKYGFLLVSVLCYATGLGMLVALFVEGMFGVW